MWFPRALPLKLFRPIQYLFPPYWDSPLLSVTALNNGVTLLFLVKYESIFMWYDRAFTLKEDAVMSCLPVCCLKWSMMKNARVNIMFKNISRVLNMLSRFIIGEKVHFVSYSLQMARQLNKLQELRWNVLTVLKTSQRSLIQIVPAVYYYYDHIS